MGGRISMSVWTIFQSPPDYVGKFIARETIIASDGERRVALLPIIDKDLASLRQIMREKGLYRFPRHELDDESVVETWM
jgi:hypothetical protein